MEILQAFGGPEIVEEEPEVTEETATETVAVTEEFMEEQPEPTESTPVETVQEEPTSEQPEKDDMGITVQDIQTKVASKIKDVNTQLAVVNKVVQQEMTKTQPDIKAYTEQKYTDTRALYVGNNYQDLRSLDEYKREIYTDVSGHEAMFANDPLYKYQQRMRGR